VKLLRDEASGAGTILLGAWRYCMDGWMITHDRRYASAKVWAMAHHMPRLVKNGLDLPNERIAAICGAGELEV